jgi:hypothetical protein
MVEEFEEIAVHDVDASLSLVYCLGPAGPFTLIVNRVTGKRKSVSLAWFLKESREMQIRTGPGSTVVYPVRTIEEALYDLVSRATSHPRIKPLIWAAFRAVVELLHHPKLISRESEFSLLPEEKRSALWIAWVPSGAPQGILFPCFSLQEPEREALSRKIGDPDKIRIQASEIAGGVVTGRGISTALMRTDPRRWYLPPMIEAVAAVLGMQEGGGRESPP